MVSYLAFQGNPLLTINQSSLWMPKVDIFQKGLPFIADKGYDAVDIIESLLDRGFEPTIRIKETMRMRLLASIDWGG